MLSRLFSGKQKAWVSALITMVAVYIAGDTPTPESIEGFMSLSGELVWALVAYALTWAFPNVPDETEKVVTAATPVETIGYEDPERFPEVKV